MVFIPGGAYVLGDGAGYDPTPLVERGDAVVVTLNYRLGPFGFLTLPGLDAESTTGTSGNWGLLDQQLALRWVRDDIAAFGGDARAVTLFGESAGGNSVCEQLASPAAAGLFDRAIVESGACVGTPLGPLSEVAGQDTGVRFAAGLGCADPATMVACLRAVPAKLLVAGPTTALTSLAATWTPTLDGTVLPRSPADALASGRVPPVPLLMGSNHDEGRLFTALFQHLHLNPVSESFYQSDVAERFGAGAAEVLARYPSARFGSPSLALSATVTDQTFACPAQWTAQAAHTGGADKAGLWTYELDEPNPPQVLPDPFMALRSYHGAELTYLFDSISGIPVVRDTAQRTLSDQLVGYWTRFAATGNPNGAGLPGWPAWSAGARPVQTLTSRGTAPHDDTAFLADHMCGFWGPRAGIG